MDTHVTGQPSLGTIRGRLEGYVDIRLTEGRIFFGSTILRVLRFAETVCSSEHMSRRDQSACTALSDEHYMWINPSTSTRPSTMASRGPSPLTLSSSQAAKETIDSAITKRIFAPRKSPTQQIRRVRYRSAQAKEAALFHFNYRNESPNLAIKRYCTVYP